MPVPLNVQSDSYYFPINDELFPYEDTPPASPSSAKTLPDTLSGEVRFYYVLAEKDRFAQPSMVVVVPRVEVRTFEMLATKIAALYPKAGKKPRLLRWLDKDSRRHAIAEYYWEDVFTEREFSYIYVVTNELGDCAVVATEKLWLYSGHPFKNDVDVTMVDV